MGRKGYFQSTVGKKQLVGITGLALCGFLFGHVSGNFLMFLSPKAYNMYGHNLISNPAIYVIEAGLMLLLIGHVVNTIWLTVINKKSRPQGYAVSAKGEKKTSATTKSMHFQGIVVLVFIVLHIITFKYGTIYYVDYDGQQIRDLYRLLVEVFQSPIYVFWYVAALAVLGMHLSHGFQSTFKSLGFNHPKYEPKLKLAGVLFTIYVTAGFIVQPLYMFFIKG